MSSRRAWNLGLAAAAWLATSIAYGAEARRESTPSWNKIAGEREAGRPVLAVVGLRQQKITVYDSVGPILQAPISTGQRGYETPAGIFTILQKNKDHVSNLYEAAEMPFMQRVTWSGVALHAGALPGYRASHGCIRLPYRFAEGLFGLTSVGTRVVIVPDRSEATDIVHPTLQRLSHSGASATPAHQIEDARQQAIQALEEADELAKRAEAAAKVARRAEAAKEQALKSLSAAVDRAAAQKNSTAKARAETKVEKLRAEASAKTVAAKQASDLATAASAEHSAAQARARSARQRAWPLSIFISRRTQRLYVRQGFEPLFEMPVRIKDPDKTLGTHAFYATESSDGRRGWLGVTVTAKSAGRSAEQALDRIEIPGEVAQLMASSAWMASAVLVSDEPPHKETGASTDFIVVLSDEPQGALKIRERQPMAEVPPRPDQSMRGYRAASDDAHFRHPLGFGP